MTPMSRLRPWLNCPAEIWRARIDSMASPGSIKAKIAEQTPGDQKRAAIARRGRNLRRQLVDVLCLRQGKRRHASARRAIRPRLPMRRLPLRRLPVRQRLRLPLRRLRRLRVRRLRLLLVVGSVPHLLTSCTFQLRRQTQFVMAGFGLDPAMVFCMSGTGPQGETTPPNGRPPSR